MKRAAAQLADKKDSTNKQHLKKESKFLNDWDAYQPRIVLQASKLMLFARKRVLNISSVFRGGEA